MEISLGKILNEIVEEMTQDGLLTEGADPSAVPTDAPSEEINAGQDEDDVILNKLASIFTPEEADFLVQKLESGEISEDDIIAHLANSEEDPNPPVMEAYLPTMPIALAIGVGGLRFRNGY